MTFDEQTLKAKGYVQINDGIWFKPLAAPIRPLEANSPKPAPLQALDGIKPQRQSGKSGVAKSAGIVTMIAMRKRLLDPDAVHYACKPLTDAIAAFLGVDDADPAWRWEWSQQRTEGEEGVIVKIERRA